jgi:hypothetical protein
VAGTDELVEGALEMSAGALSHQAERCGKGVEAQRPACLLEGGEHLGAVTPVAMAAFSPGLAVFAATALRAPA